MRALCATLAGVAKDQACIATHGSCGFPSRRRTLVTLLALMQCGSALAAERPWLEVKSAHFTVLTNASEKAARDVAWQFEQMRAALQRLWPWAKFSAGKPVFVLAAKDEATLKALAPHYWEKGENKIVSVSVEGRDRHYLALQIDSSPSNDVRVNPYFNAYRAYVHIVLAASFDRPLPPWLSTGMSELLGNLRVRDSDVFLGRLVPWHIELLRQREGLPLAALIAMDRGSPFLKDSRQLFDAESWGFLHYLMFGDEGRHAARLDHYATLLAQGAKPEVALRETFPDLLALEKGFNSYIHLAALQYRRIDIDVSLEREKFPTRAASAAESNAVRAAFHVAMRRPAEAAVLLAEAKAADQAAPEPFDVEGLLADSASDDDKARTAYAKAVELGSRSFYTWYRDAQLHGRADRAAQKHVEKSVQRCVELNPEFAFGYSYLAEMKLRLSRATDALELARKAIALEPGQSYHHIAFAHALFDNGKRDEAVSEAERALALADNEHERGSASEMLQYVSKASVRTAPAEGPIE